MPDWRAYVRNRLGALSASDAEREEIVSELAEHLEQHYADLRASGVDEQEAYRNTRA